MQIFRESAREERNKTALLFGIGLVLGILIMNVGKSILLVNTGLFDEDTLYQMKYVTVDRGALFCYILRKRLSTICILSVAVTTYLGLILCTGITLWYGISAGMLVSSLMLRYGLKGLLLALVGVLPQYIIYIPAFLLFLNWGTHLYRSIYRRGLGGDATEKGFAARKLGQLACIVGLVVVGCFLEGYINPFFLLGFLKRF